MATRSRYADLNNRITSRRKASHAEIGITRRSA